MISSLRGTVLHVEADAVVVEVSGVGYAVGVPPQLARAARPGEELFLHTSLIVREDALSLVGFETREELGAFGLLLGVAGVGPKSALGVLASLTVAQIAQAVADEDDAPFRRVSGIGPKTAKLIVVQLSGKLLPVAAPATAPAAPAGTIVAQVVQALVGLGWSERVAAQTAEEVAEGAADPSVPVLLRLALAQLGPARKEPAGG
jgi:holliday junction DNA helicase RuvA